MDKQTIVDLIQKYQGKVDHYQAMIAELQGELGDFVAPASIAASSDAKTVVDAGNPLAAVKEYQFYGKSQPEAARLLLELVGRPLSTEQMVEGLEKGSVEVGGTTAKDKKQNLYTILGRSGQFGRAAKNTWGLLGWPKVQPVKKGVKENGQEKEAEAESGSEKTEPASE